MGERCALDSKDSVYRGTTARDHGTVEELNKVQSELECGVMWEGGR